MTTQPANEDKQKYVRTPEQNKMLERMKKDWEEKKKIPAEKRIPVSNPGKYNFPIGFNEDGMPLPGESPDDTLKS